MKVKECSFCGKNLEESAPIIANDRAAICTDCLEECYSLSKELSLDPETESDEGERGGSAAEKAPAGKVPVKKNPGSKAGRK